VLIGISAGGKTFFSLVVASDKSTSGVFRDGIDLKIHVGKSVYVDAEIFHDYLHNVLTLKIEEFT
jgi:hypothetical protein